jgi:predicted DNA-binding protein (UPF0278 family)
MTHSPTTLPEEKDFLRDDIRIAVWEWIRESAPTGIKLTMTADLSDELIDTIEKRLRRVGYRI